MSVCSYCALDLANTILLPGIQDPEETGGFCSSLKPTCYLQRPELNFLLSHFLQSVGLSGGDAELHTRVIKWPRSFAAWAQRVPPRAGSGAEQRVPCGSGNMAAVAPVAARRLLHLGPALWEKGD